MIAAHTRRTLARESEPVAGVGLFTSAPTRVTFAPGAGGLAISINGSAPTPATIDTLHAEPIHPAFAQLPPRHTNIATPAGVAVTVEHALSALAGLGVTDAVVRIDAAAGPAAEVPIMDGSSRDFVRAIAEAGLEDLAGTREPIVVAEPIEVTAGEASIRVEPASAFSCEYRLDYSGAGDPPPIAAQRVFWSGDPDEYADAIAPARTYCLAAEAELLNKAGLFTHLTPRDMLVLEPATADRPATPIDNELRFADEPARHKLLDLIGDLALAGRPMLGRVVASRSGHALTHELVRRLVRAPAAR